MEGAQDIALATEPGRKRAGGGLVFLEVFASGQLSRKARRLGRRRGLRNKLGLVMW